MNTHLNIEKKLDFLTNNSIVFIAIIVFVSLFVRLYYFPYGVPIVLDGLSYFLYATDVSVSWHLPSGYTMPNNGWPVFLSFFFVCCANATTVATMDNVSGGLIVLTDVKCKSTGMAAYSTNPKGSTGFGCWFAGPGNGAW